MHHTDPFAPAVHTAHAWLAEIGRTIGTDDRAFTYQLVRAWLHAVRDRLTVPAAARLGAQLPELLRGVYYEHWTPEHVPLSHHPDEFVAAFAAETAMAHAEIPAMIGLVTTALEQLFSPGQLGHVYAVFPAALVDLLLGVTPHERDARDTGADRAVIVDVDVVEIAE